MCNNNISGAKNEEIKDNRKNVPFETALDLTGFGKNNYFTLFACSTALLGAIMELFGLSFIVQTAACDLNLTLEQRGLLSGLPMVGVVFTAFFWGFVTDTKGRRTALLISMTTAFVFSSLSSFAPNMITMATLKFLSVTFSSGAYGTAYTLLGEYQPLKYRDKILVLLTCSNAITETIMVAMAYPILTFLDFKFYLPILGIMYRPWRLMVVAFSLPMAISAICFIFVDESPKYLISQGQDQKALDVLRKIYVWNTGYDANKYPVHSLLHVENSKPDKEVPFIRSMWAQFVPLFKNPYRKYTTIICFLSASVCFVANAFGMWLPYIFNKFIQGLTDEKVQNENFCTVFNNNITVVNLNDGPVPGAGDTCDDSINDSTYAAICTFSTGAFVLIVFTAFLVNFLGKRWLLIGMFLVTGFCGFILNWVNVPIASLALFILFNYVFLGMGVLPAFIVDIYPTHVRGMAGSLSTVFVRLGSFVGIYLTGIIFEPYCEETFYIYSSLIFLCASAAFLLPLKPLKSDNQA